MAAKKRAASYDETLHESFAKNALQSAAAVVGESVGNMEFARQMSRFISSQFGALASRGLTWGAGISLASLLKLKDLSRIPGLAGVFQTAGIDADSTLTIANEVVDALTKSFADQIGQNATIPEDAIRARAEQVARERVAKIKDPAKELAGDLGNMPVLVRTSEDPLYPGERLRRVHHIDCLDCGPAPHRTKNGIVPRLPDNVRKTTLGFVMQNRLQPSDEDCCAASIRDLFKKAGTKPLDLERSVATQVDSSPGAATTTKYLLQLSEIVDQATPEQKERLRKLAKQKIWEKRGRFLAMSISLVRTERDGNAVYDVGRFISNLEVFAEQTLEEEQEEKEKQKSFPQLLLDYAEGKSNKLVDGFKKLTKKAEKRIDDAHLVGYWQQQVLTRALKGED